MAFLAWVLPCMGATLIITCSKVIRPFREHCKAQVGFVGVVGSIAVCPMCAGFWVGVVSSALGSSLQTEDVLLPLRMFADGLASSVCCWSLHVVLTRLGQKKLLVKEIRSDKVQS